MNDTLVLSRYKDKNPPAKQAVETQKVKSKVEKASKKRRSTGMVKLDPRYEQRLAEMDHEVAMMQLENDEVRLTQARNLNERAEEYMNAHDTDYTTALREVVRLSERGETEPSVAEVERYMRENDISDFGQAVRALSPRTLHERRANIDAQQDAEIRRIAKERGYGDL